MWVCRITTIGVLIALAFPVFADGPPAREADPAYYHEGDLAGSLRSDSPLPIYDAEPGHLWNRIFAALSIRHSHLPSRRGGPPIDRIEGGDQIDFLGWAHTTYWSEPATCSRLNALLDEFLNHRGDRAVSDPLRRAVFQRDLWAAFDFLIGQNIERFGTSPSSTKEASTLAPSLASCIRSLRVRSARAVTGQPAGSEATRRIEG